jgi:anti-sigma B factor antagonist
MQIETTSGPDCTFVKPLERRIDASSASGLKEKIQECIRAGAKHIVLDLSMVDFIDSSGLGAIISIRKVLGEGGDLSLAAPKDAVVSLLKLTRMDKIFRLYKEPEAALATSHHG